MKIKELADKLNISARAIRFYEEKGLLSPRKETHNSYRTFEEKDIWRLQTIISLREAGMPLSNIKQALQEIDSKGHGELHYYLELQRSVMMKQWLEIRQVIETTDHMISLLKNNHTLPLEDIYCLAAHSKQMREQRGNWQDKWNFNRLASTHDIRVTGNSGTYMDYELALEELVKWVAPIQGELGLDIGTGTGNLAGRLMDRGALMSGVDQSKEMLRLCQTKYPAMDTRLGNFLALPYLGGQFHFIVSSFAFHHLTEEQQVLALEEMRRVARSHGRICIADLMNSGPAAADAEQRDLDPMEDNISLPSLLQWFEDNGYVTKQKQLNRRLHIVYAIPIRGTQGD
ncbi:2-methoxy-6-polyprenyl-1,4-benzoquinol methylase, mitochondrial [Paenibacillus plantiphilus]|uniref:2-methoxy-6-polyprenyl-1,4-benzoquinol methylase, mitochondrial n=1 Tax=Paenibacillus plantiphilus TaxID=2905650 RepID=A0ABN8GPP7_9BACL|nr:MerR family transcriptional regulator [Paenibacillus plantiphilus]CAH1212687.1 2-methoxy-6-polyprenyl-1,4-benzoquinol methylase, mitochondrial [Paenibacillus plantiphilus]